MTRHLKIISALFAALTFVFSCGRRTDTAGNIDKAHFSIDISGKKVTIRTAADSITFTPPLRRLVCMSTSYVAYLSSVGIADAVCGVSGIRYLTDTCVRRRYEEGLVADVGSDAAPDYEKIVGLAPDLVLTYSMPGSSFVSHLRSLAIPVLVLDDYLENSPLARASYVKIFGSMTGRMAAADSVYNTVCQSYNEIMSSAGNSTRVNVLMNIPYGDAWYIPGGENYMTRLVNDAGGTVLGAVQGRTESSVISVEQALGYSAEADFWLNTGWCDTRIDLYSQNPVFKSMHVQKIFNNTLRVTSGGGNDFWESGAVRPDLILHDLVQIFHQQKPDTLYYYKEVL